MPFVRKAGTRGSLTSDQSTRCNEKHVCKNKLDKTPASKGDESARVYQMKIKSANGSSEPGDER
jgi:hypothetical protein